MIECASIYTCEVDDPQIALEELTTQLSQKITLRENTVGIVMCHPEFIHSGVLSHVANNLPFDIAGSTTSSQSVNDTVSELALTILVITSDDTRFYIGSTDSVEDEIDGPVAQALKDAGTEQPKLSIVFPPLMIKYPGDSYVEAWEKCMPGVPLFGTQSVDDSLLFTDSHTIYGGEVSKSNVTFILCYGNINPRFLISTLPEDSALPYKGTITKSVGHIVHEIDNRLAEEYMSSMGFVDGDDKAMGVYWFVPFMMSQKGREDYDGVPIMRGFAEISPEGQGIFRGKVDEGAEFTMHNMNNESVITATSCTVEEILEMNDVKCVLGFSCIVRRMTLMNTNSTEELAVVKEKLGEIPFLMAYSGGEICPTSVKNDVAINRFHNFTMVILVL